MIKKISYIVLGLFVASCGSSTDKRAELSQLKKDRDAINTQIEKLQKEIKNEGGKQIEHATMVSVEQFNAVEFKHFLEIQGMVESDNNILIPVQAGGLVKALLVKEGDRVSKGQVLAQIDADLIRKGIEELNLSRNLATTVFERQERLWKQKIGSEVQYLQAKTQKESLDKKLQSLNKQLELTKIISPINGTIDQVLLKEGEMAAPGKGAIRVVDISDLKITASLSEAYVNDVNAGDLVSVNIPSIASISVEKVLSVSKVINPSNRTFSIEVKLPNIKNIKPNMLSVLSINDYTKTDAILVPMNILQNTGKDFFVFKAVERDGKWYAEKTSVKAGKYYNNKIEILEGVSKGDYLVTFGFQQISDGSLLTISK